MMLSLCVFLLTGCGAPKEEWAVVVAAGEATRQVETFSYQWKYWREDKNGEQFGVQEESGICYPCDEGADYTVNGGNIMRILFFSEDGVSNHSQCITQSLEEGSVRYDFTVPEETFRKAYQQSIDYYTEQLEQETNETIRIGIISSIDHFNDVIKNTKQTGVTSFTIDAEGRIIHYSSRVESWEYGEFTGTMCIEFELTFP